MPGSARREQAGTSVRDPSSSTTQTRQTFTGVRVSRKQSVGVSMPRLRAASRIVAPSGAETALPSIVISIWRRSGAGGASGIGPLGMGISGEGASLMEQTPSIQSGFDRARGGLAETADRGVAHGLSHLAQGGQFGGAGPNGRPATRRCSVSSCRTVPTRHGTHWPHDSSRKKRRCAAGSASGRRYRRRASRRPSRASRRCARVPSKVSGMSSSSGVTNVPAAPPSRTACRSAAAGARRRRARSARECGAEGHFVEARARDVAGEAEELRARSTAPFRCARTPRRRQQDFRKVDERLDVVHGVGLPKRPAASGKGGLLRGSPRLPSIELKSAVSSPQM